MTTTWDIPIGGHLSRQERMNRLGGAKYGGIEASSTSPNVFVYSDPARGVAYGYNFDGWTETGRYSSTQAKGARATS